MEQIIMLICCWGSGALFFGIGMWAEHSRKPIHFWAGAEVAPETVTDIPAYNLENAVMWKEYSIAYWIAGFCSFYSDLYAGILLMIAGIPGLVLLFRRYMKIEKEFIRKP